MKNGSKADAVVRTELVRLIMSAYAQLPKALTYVRMHFRVSYALFVQKASADRILREACYRLGIEGVSTHSFRRTALTWMSDNGVPLRHIQSISGHRTLASLERYLGVTDQQRRACDRDLEF